MSSKEQFKSVKTLMTSRNKNVKKLEAKNEGYSRSAQRKKIKTRKGSYPLNFPEQIGFQY